MDPLPAQVSSTGATELPGNRDVEPERPELLPLTAYFLKLGTIACGGSVALVGYMRRDLVERHNWVSEETCRLALACAHSVPGPLAAQCFNGLRGVTRPVVWARMRRKHATRVAAWGDAAGGRIQAIGPV